MVRRRPLPGRDDQESRNRPKPVAQPYIVDMKDNPRRRKSIGNPTLIQQACEAENPRETLAFRGMHDVNPTVNPSEIQR